MEELSVACFAAMVAAGGSAPASFAEDCQARVDGTPTAVGEALEDEPASANVVQVVTAPPSDAAAEADERIEPETCTYRTYNWSTEERRAVNRRTVEKDYADVIDDERSPQDPRCTVCSEDQVEIDPSTFGVDLDPIQVCWAHADAIEQALREVAESGTFEFTELTGYRAGRTRGRVVDGMRTEWSNHSFGTAVDINADHNGLYRSCDVDEVTTDTIDECRLGVGGEWNPERYPSRTITAASVVYDKFINVVNWRWGGEIDGRTRDMMHFSPDGY